ncbi:MAG TPA: serine/threonine-protein kinase [Kofleriaceae bacterium]|nr:serine/threonine-protein kinase [Kofleriaceae bacterium]
MGRTPSVVALVLGLGGAGALVATARTPASGPTAAAIDAVAQELDARWREATATAVSRAQTLADLPRLQVAVATDAATVRDLTGEELAFRPQPGETIEIAQRPRGGGAPVSLLRIPESSKVAAPLERDGTRLLRLGRGLAVSAVVAFPPRERADEIVGVVAVTRPPDMSGVTALLDPVGGGVVLKTSIGDIPIGRPLSGATVEVPLRSDASQGASLLAAAPVPAGWRSERVYAAAALAALGLLVAAFLWRRGRAALPRVSPITPTAAELGRRPARGEHDGGVRIGRYTVLRKLGAGGMADVYLARSEGEAGFERQVALKVMLDEFASNPKFVSHFLDEARLAPRLAHPNIVAVTDLGKEGDCYVIAMEFVDGADLSHLLQAAGARGELIPVPVALAIVRRVCDGLHYAHTATDAEGNPLMVVHRDVKAANVFVARNGAVKVGDFGIAKIASATRTAKTEIGEVKGTAAYMAPEQRVGEDVDARADVYAVGAICYELLTGKEINLDLAKLAHLGRVGWPHLRPPSQERAGLPPELDDLVFRAMAFERADRFASCEELDQAIGEVASRHGLDASDKVIARWIAAELAASAPGAHAAAPTVTEEAEA